MQTCSSRGDNSPNIMSRFLCLDTCIILDIIRDPTRSDIRTQEQIASMDLLRLAECEEDLVVLVADQVHEEFLANVDTVQKDARNALSRFRDLASKLDQLSDLHGAPGRIDPSHLDDHEVRCRNVANRWLRTSTPIPQSVNPSIVPRSWHVLRALPMRPGPKASVTRALRPGEIQGSPALKG